MVYTIINQKKLGSGSYGDVYVVEDEHGEKMAVKIINPSKLSYVELDILSRLKSPYVIRSVGDPVVEIQHSHGITLQLKENCLHKLNTRRLPYYQLKRIMVSCLFGLRCMHSKGYLHNDLVLRNILYDKNEDDDYLAYLADFSVSVRCLDAQKGISVRRVVKGTHIPIEILDGLINKKKNFRYNDKTDVWSLGLCFLEMIDKKYYFNNMHEQMDFFEGIDSDFIKGKVKLYARGTRGDQRKMNKKEELYLTEILTHMLKKNPEDRMGTDDIMYLNFIRTTSIPYDCSLNKPSELIVVPVGEASLRDGVSRIREFFKEDGSAPLSSYFLALQIYIRIMNTIIVDDSDFDFEEVIHVSISTAMNYYDRKVEAGYEGGIILKGEVGYSPYYYAANFVEELKLVDEYIDKGGNFLTIFNFLNPYELFYQFRLMYDYGDENKVTNRLTYEQYLEIELPKPKENVDIKIYMPQDYSNVLDDKREKSSLAREKEVEEIFNSILIDYIKGKVKSNYRKKGDDFPDIYELAKNYVEGGTQIRKKEVYKNIREKDIFSSLIGLNNYFEYGIVIINLGNITKQVFHDRKFVVVMNEGVTSLLHINSEEKSVTHYYSEPNKIIEDFYKDRGYDYTNNFEFGINNCCKVIDSCVMFIIFYNNFTGSLNFNMKCISEETNFVIFLSLFV